MGLVLALTNPMQQRCQYAMHCPETPHYLWNWARFPDSKSKRRPCRCATEVRSVTALSVHDITERTFPAFGFWIQVQEAGRPKKVTMAHLLQCLIDESGLLLLCTFRRYGTHMLARNSGDNCGARGKKCEGLQGAVWERLTPSASRRSSFPFLVVAVKLELYHARICMRTYHWSFPSMLDL